MSDDGREPATRSIASGHFHLFVYGTLRASGESHEQIADCVFVRAAYVLGTLYDIDGLHPALMLYGHTRIDGEIWLCPADRLLALDNFEGVERGLFRRVAVSIEDTPCWTYVAGPALAHRLTPAQRLDHGSWPATAQADGHG
jgi:gamma-glutamylcyclotransferase (GGCT)/AIG2-like uncharacterized protein YtfP